jgi:hypothetical protein
MFDFELKPIFATPQDLLKMDLCFEVVKKDRKKKLINLLNHR